jgi:hypothetical protein
MKRYKLTLTLRDFQRRLAKYPPEALWAAQQALQNIERKKGVLYEPSEEEQRDVHKELLIAMYKSSAMRRSPNS